VARHDLPFLSGPCRTRDGVGWVGPGGADSGSAPAVVIAL